MNEPVSGWPESVDDELLPQRLADALRDGAVGLAVDDQRVDAAADVVDAGVAREREAAGFRIDLDFAHRAAVGEHRIVHLVVGDDGEALGEIVGQGVLAPSPAPVRENRSCGWCRAR